MPVKYKVLWTYDARFHLSEIYDYICQFSEPGAKQLTKRIKSKADKLKKHPFIGQKEELLEELGQNHRYIVSDNYKIVYLFEDRIIFIVAVFDTRSDPDSLIKKII
jgi:toxin ParE1/3/4